MSLDRRTLYRDDFEERKNAFLVVNRIKLIHLAQCEEHCDQNSMFSTGRRITENVNVCLIQVVERLIRVLKISIPELGVKDPMMRWIRQHFLLDILDR